jgi:hypothetical protein
VPEKGEIELVFFIASISNASIQFKYEQQHFPCSCAIHVEEMVFEKGEREVVFFVATIYLLSKIIKTLS